jgi:subtilisin family serine protease
MRPNHRSASGIFSRLKCRLLTLALFCALAAAPAQAEVRLIVRIQGGALVLNTACILLGCTVQYPLGDDQGQVFLVTAPLNLTANLLLSVPGVLDVELDSIGQTLGATQTGAPAALYDATPVNYYGTTVREGYVTQPAAQIIGLATTQGAFGVRGSGIVAVIDTGVDSTHPGLANALVPGYDFTRNQAGEADEKGDVGQSTTAVIDQSTTAVVDQSTTAVIDSYTASQLNQPQYQAFGHGTMVSGVVRLVAPGAMIMPLKAFHADGTGYASDVIRAVYFAVQHHARILNMSFSFQSSPLELNLALNYAKLNGVISVAAAGNDGKQTMVYPAGYSGTVMGVASTSNNDTLSTFSNYGPNLVWVGAPGEGVVTFYPYGTYAATWGTSFSTPFVAGAAALLLDVQSACTESQAAQALAHARYINSNVGNGRLDLYQAVQAWRQAAGLF